MAKANGSEVLTHKEDPILSPNKFGEMIGKTGQTIRNWIRDGLLTPIRYPGEKTLFGIRQSDAIKLISNSALADKVKDNG